MVGFCHLTDSHHYHHGQKPTMVGICHGGNMLGNQHEDAGDHDDESTKIMMRPTTKMVNMITWLSWVVGWPLIQFE